ncbi:hypothetical protein [Salinisphaera sp. Q1T1-3]|uniref:hypothetical protein n=1 Tax=Salinisphaera sp. Q1T1-3 TaxID=2321229 RepID=UPI000E738863|nr:hypothetical protein [Salinisphaera sp. Q1T1-3]RJS92506.1 hypothetical protein D3260_11280 [Salinisphaera sp. Q1T1-3]
MTSASIPALAAGDPAEIQTSHVPAHDLGAFVDRYPDIGSFRSALGPRRTAGDHHVADLDMRPSKQTGDAPVFDSSDRYFALTDFKRGDFNGDRPRPVDVSYESAPSAVVRQTLPAGLPVLAVARRDASTRALRDTICERQRGARTTHQQALADLAICLIDRAQNGGTYLVEEPLLLSRDTDDRPLVGIGFSIDSPECSRYTDRAGTSE